MSPARLSYYVRLCAWTLARAHARSRRPRRHRRLSRLRPRLRPRARGVRRALRRPERARPRRAGDRGPRRPRRRRARGLTAVRSLRRLVPAVAWLPRYDRRWLRGDVIAGIAVTALIVPKNLGYAGIAGIPLAERPLRGGGRRDHLRALLHVAADLDRAELVARGGRGRRRDRRPALAGEEAAQLVAAITLATGAAVPAARHLQAGLDRAVPVQGGRHRLPRRRRHRRRHRRAAQAHRHGRGGDSAWRELASLDRVARRHARDDAARRAPSRSR